MGTEEDPKDGGAVAGAVFGAVFIYLVRTVVPRKVGKLLTPIAGLLRLLRIPSLPAPTRKPSRRDKPVVMTVHTRYHGNKKDSRE
jgi:hypothetical protein